MHYHRHQFFPARPVKPLPLLPHYWPPRRCRPTPASHQGGFQTKIKININKVCKGLLENYQSTESLPTCAIKCNATLRTAKYGEGDCD